jgi:hypothetical protein
MRHLQNELHKLRDATLTLQAIPCSVYMYTRTHARTRTHTHTRTHARTHTHTYTHTHTLPEATLTSQAISFSLYVCVRECVFSLSLSLSLSHTHTQTHTHTHTHTYIHTHIHIDLTSRVSVATLSRSMLQHVYESCYAVSETRPRLANTWKCRGY